MDRRATATAARVTPVAVRIVAVQGFAFPALELAVNELAAMAPRAGIAVAAVTRSHHCGAAGLHVEALASRRLVGLMFASTPKAISLWGERQTVFGTNPIAFAAPRREWSPLVIDLSLSRVARGKILVASQRGHAIPEGWALDADGLPTTNPMAVLAGTLLPMGKAKGAALVLMVEIPAAAVTA